MRIPYTICENTLKTYKVPEKFIIEEKGIVSGNLTDWDAQLPKSLQEICVEKIAKCWQEEPILEEILSPINKHHLLDLLSPDLPLALTVPRIKYEIYWKKCFQSRWPKSPTPLECSNHVESTFPIVQTSGSSSRRSSVKSENLANSGHWKQCYIEKHVQQYLEKLKCEDYEPERIKELCDLCGPFVHKLHLPQLQFSSIPPHRIPLNGILAGLDNITDLSLCFKQTYVGERFSWDILQTSFQDIELLAKGLEKLRLVKLRIYNTDIDDAKLDLILKALYKQQTIRTLNFSHCKIADNGMLALCNFFLHQPLASLLLSNNKIGLKGIQALGLALCQPECTINEIDLHLNDIYDQGGTLLMQYVAYAATLTHLNLASCGLTENFQFNQVFTINHTLRQLDLSNNALKEENGKLILEGLTSSSLHKLDLRMCGISSETELLIQQKLTKNRRKCIQPLEKDIKTLPIELDDKEVKESIENSLN